MQKAIGFIACVSVMAMSLYLFSGGDPSRILSAQTESTGSGYGAVARRFLSDAQQLAKQGNVKEARRLAETAASLSASWTEGEQTPQQFLATLDQGASGLNSNPFNPEATNPWPTLDTDQPSEPTATAAAEEAPLPQNASMELVNRRKAQQLMKEAREALDVRDLATARARAMQARTFKVSWGLWDERPEQLLSEISREEGTTTFLADGSVNGATVPTGASAEETYQAARKLLEQARAAMDAGKLQQATELAQQARALNATYSLWDDSPEMVQRDLQRLTQVGAAPSIVFDEGELAPSDQEQSARTLLREAREALLNGKLGIAQEKAQQAQSLNVAYSLLDDRPELVLAEVEQALTGQSRLGSANAENVAVFAGEEAGFRSFENSGPLDMTPQAPAANPFASEFAAGSSEVPRPAQNRISVATADSNSADQAMNAGLSLLNSGQEAAGREALAQAWNQADQLAPHRRAQLQDILTQLSADQSVSLVANAEPKDEAFEVPMPSNMAPMADSDPLKDAANELDVRFARLRTEVLNSMFRAEKLKEENPEEALEALDRTLATVEAADLPDESAKVLSGHLERAQKSIRTYMDQRAPIIAMQNRNRNTQEKIERDLQNQIRIEQEFADLTQQFNDLMRQRRYAEAELIAKKAKDLNPGLPQAVIMVEKAKLQRQIAKIEDFKEKKADNALEMLNGVEESFAGSVSDYTLGDAKSWADMSARRAKYGRADSRTRTESELKIEKSLNEQISLHFHDVPLTDIIRNIATTHGINIALDTRAIETEGLQVNQSVSIDVDGITLRSALNLLLDQAGGLVYDIENEVLKITNRLEQETRFELAVYNVADLVVPLSLQKTPDPMGTAALASSYAGSGLFQVDDDLAVGIGGNGLPRGAANGGRPDNGVDFSGLIDLISTTVEPGSWDIDGGAGRLNGNENTLSLVIRQTPAVHEQIVDLLGQLRKLQDLQVTVEVRFISVTDRFFERIGVDFDFNVQDTLGDPAGTPAFGSRQLTFPNGGGAAGGGGGNNNQDLRGGNAAGGGGGGQQGQQGQQGAVAAGLFDSIQRVNAPRDDFNGQTVGLASPDSFTEDYDIQFRQGSFELGVPDFGNFNPDAGIQVGMAILSDIEAFFFIQAAQADERANIMFAPKVTLFNGQLANIQDTTNRPFVVALIPVVGTGAVGFQPVIQQIQDGITLDVVAVISADRRFVRLSLGPQFFNVVDVFTFSFASGGAGGGAIGGGGGQQGGGFGGGAGGVGGGGGFGGGGGGGVAGGGGQQGQQGQQGNAGGGGGTLTVQQPVQEQISVSTTVSVPDGGTVLLGGIKRLREGRNMAGVPILNKIPYVSRLFKNSGVGRETESVMLMVTPRIIIHEEEEELILGTSGL